MIRVAVVDDEEPARRKLADLLGKEPDVSVVAEAADGLAAVRAIGAEEPDAVFLDVQMPGLDGFGVVDAIGPERAPAVVFVTAFDEYAVRAFEAGAVDYLLKPFAPSRLRRALDRLRSALSPPNRRAAAAGLERALAAAAQGSRYLKHLLAEKGENRHVLVAAEEIERVEAERDGLLIVTHGGPARRRGTLTGLEGRLDPERFLRINRSEIVRLDAVREFQPWFHGDWRVVMKDGSTRSFSRRYRSRARHLFEP